MDLLKMIRGRILILLLILSASTCLYGQTAEDFLNEEIENENVDPDQESQVTASQRPIEEILVTGQRTLISLRNEIRRETENLYNMFNDLNSHDRFDIECKGESRLGTAIITVNCYPRFFTDLRRTENSAGLSQLRQDGVDSALFALGVSQLKTDREIRELAAGDYQALSEEMLRIASENPDYLNILMKVADLKANYEAARKERFESDN